MSTDAKPSVFVALVHETLKAESFDTLADLAEAVKCRAARLHIRYDSERIGTAIDQVERIRGRVLTLAPTAPQPKVIEQWPPTQDEAREVLRRYGVQA